MRLIVVIEDDEGLRNALCRVLRNSGYAVRAFDSAESLFSDGEPDDAAFMVIDLNLPGASGVDLYASLHDPRPPAVFITSQDSKKFHLTQHPIVQGRVLIKPFHGKDLLKEITRVIGE